MVDEPTRAFYDALAERYHLIFADWPASVRRQGVILDRIIRSRLGWAPESVLDCACGIGTQAIGLALLGHRVHATDRSPAAVRRAGREAASFGVALTTGVADLRDLETRVDGTFDVVLAGDNALAHLLTVHDLRRALRGMRAKLRPGGLLLASIRDYDAILAERPAGTLPVRHGPVGERRIVFQTWDWADAGPTYSQRLFLLVEGGRGWNVAEFEAASRAIRREELDALLHEEGAADIRWLMPAESGFYQPIVTATFG